jgi:hypothetical protein
LKLFGKKGPAVVPEYGGLGKGSYDVGVTDFFKKGSLLGILEG